MSFENFTDDNVAEMQAMYRLFDCKNKDNSITREEMQMFCNKLGIYPSDSELTYMF